MAESEPRQGMKPKEEPAEHAGPSAEKGKEEEASTAPLPEKVSNIWASILPHTASIAHCDAAALTTDLQDAHHKLKFGFLQTFPLAQRHKVSCCTTASAILDPATGASILRISNHCEHHRVGRS